ncbi:glycine N-acyltransferase-like protein 3 [Nerophis lumbriciformis]|uniref:glycine N-acyltransferase-like protein 3 n=1 Tax=Nerophis lumbriciformis TaxID=546530 RepID=UPI002AE09B68|nr:glycine N-acyltransferase-like protein 3 [Nerophis lumbriciformis]XP_061816070.1 glycine N-acyltransferase-like protein 3 [Nerophis lumbriciformis]
MKVLQKDEIKIAESILRKDLPKSFQVYGLLYAYNRNKPSNLMFIVDTWPDFKVIICRPDPENNLALELAKKITFYCKDEQILKKMLLKDEVVDWSSYFIVGGIDSIHTLTLKEVASNRQVSYKPMVSAHLLYLPDHSSLITPVFDSALESRVSPLSPSHVDLVNQTWKFGGDEHGYNKIKVQVSNMPSCCITDDQGRPVSWILLYEYMAMGMLYTLPEHRRKGYAKVLVYTMAQTLLNQGYPVFCFIEEENTVSYKLFKSLGFIEDPSYRILWAQLNL